MSGDNANIVRGMYEAFGKGDMPFIVGALDLRWNGGKQRTLSTLIIIPMSVLTQC